MLWSIGSRIRSQSMNLHHLGLSSHWTPNPSTSATLSAGLASMPPRGQHQRHEHLCHYLDQHPYLVLMVHIHAIGEQELADLDVASSCSKCKWSPAVLHNGARTVCQCQTKMAVSMTNKTLYSGVFWHSFHIPAFLARNRTVHSGVIWPVLGVI